MYDKTIIMGRLGRDPEMRYTSNGKPVCNLSVAVDRYAGPDNPRSTTWFRVAIWERGAEAANEHLHKGDTVLVEGTVDASAYMGKDGKPRASLELRASRVVFGPKGGGGDVAGVASSDVLGEEEIPFRSSRSVILQGLAGRR